MQTTRFDLSMRKQALDFSALNDVMPLLMLGAPLGIGLTGGFLQSKLSSPSKGDFERLRLRHILTLLNRYTNQAEQRTRQLRGKRD